MTTRNLSSVAPKAIALIGASNQPVRSGQCSGNLFAGGFDGPIMPVNPHEAEIQSVKCYRSVADLPAVPDLAIIATPPAAVASLITELGSRGCRSAVVITATSTGPPRPRCWRPPSRPSCVYYGTQLSWLSVASTRHQRQLCPSRSGRRRHRVRNPVRRDRYLNDRLGLRTRHWLFPRDVSWRHERMSISATFSTISHWTLRPDRSSYMQRTSPRHGNSCLQAE